MKKIHRFLLPHISTGPQITLGDSDVLHLMKQVLKLSVGEEVIVFADGTDDMLCTIASIEKTAIILTLQSTIPSIIIPRTLTACISITKRDSVELMVQKLTELGVRTIVPIISARTIKQSLRIDRLQKISDEALEQSGGSTRVHITEPVRLDSALQSYAAAPSCYFDMEAPSGGSTLSTIETFYIGPEGGWSEGDIALFKTYGVESYHLSHTVLRAETAAIVAAYTLLWH